jgi:hypothetical protein
MTDIDLHVPATLAVSGRLVRLAGWCAYVSGIVSVFGIVFLVTFFTLGGLFGTLNDVAVMVQYILMLPIALVLQQLLRPYGQGLSLAAMLIGIVGMLGVIILQFLLVIDALPFSQQIIMVVPAFLVVLAWFVINAYLGRSTNLLPNSMLLTVLAGLYIGYPFWGYSLGRRLLSSRGDSKHSLERTGDSAAGAGDNQGAGCRKRV